MFTIIIVVSYLNTNEFYVLVKKEKQMKLPTSAGNKVPSDLIQIVTGLRIGRYCPELFLVTEVLLLTQLSRCGSVWAEDIPRSKKAVAHG